MMQGMPHGSTLQLAAWLQGQLSADQLRDDLVDTLTNCRAVVACSVHKTATQSDLGGTNMLPEDVIRYCSKFTTSAFCYGFLKNMQLRLNRSTVI